MSMDISWLVEGKIIRLAIKGSLNEQQLTQLDDQMVKLLKAGSALMVHVIMEGEQLSSLPSINELSRLRYPAHPRAGWIITTGLRRKPILQTAMMLLAQILKFRHSEAENVTGALKFLENVDPHLHDMVAYS
jgi:hypothetical protein